MQILNLKSQRLHNEEHFQFHTDFNRMVENITAAVLGIEIQYGAYLTLYFSEFEALGFIRKNAITDDLEDADSLRDFTFRGLADMVKAGGNHFNPQIRQAAARVQVVFDYNGNLTMKSYDEETAAINKLVAELNEKYAADVTLLGIADWLNELQTNNEAFNTLLQNRNSVDAAKTQLRMKHVRLEVDAAFRTITDRINALIIVNGEAAYKVFVDEVNEQIKRYNNNLAIRSGRNAKDVITEETKV